MPKPHRDETESEFVERCMGDEEANESFPEPAQRLAVCHSLFQQHRSEQWIDYATFARVATCGVRQASFLGRDFLVVPAVLVRSQVLRNNLGATFLPAEEITQDWAAEWNGIPVLVGPHPSRFGQQTSGRDPDIWNARGVGWLFNVRAEDGADGTRRLTGEVWLDVARAGSVEGFQEVLDHVFAGRTVELSTGFPVETEDVQGVHDGAAFEILLHPRGADHLVISTEMTGSCAVADGCGLGANQKEDGRVSATTTDNGAKVAASGGGMGRILDRVAKLFSVPAKKFCWDDHEALRVGREIETVNQISDSDRAQRIHSALQKQFGGPDREVVLTDTFTDEQAAVFWFNTPFGAQPKGAEFFRSTWTEEDGGALHFEEPVRVRRVTRYELVEAGNTETVPEVAAEQVQQAQAVNTQEDPMAGEQNKLEELVIKLGEQVAALDGKVTELAAQSTPAEIIGLKQTVAALAGKFDKMEGVTRSAIDERERERQALVAKLAGNYRVPFNSDELEAKPVEELRKLAEMVAADNYAGRGGPQGEGRESAFMEPVSYWRDRVDSRTSKKEGR